MRQTKTFVEQELERERKSTNPSKPGFELRKYCKFIFITRPIQQAEARRKAIEKAKADYRYGVEYFTVTDKPQLANNFEEARVMTPDELRRLFDF